MSLVTAVKVCGLTSVENAIEVADTGVDAIGLVFYEHSPRFVSVDVARNIVMNLPPFVASVGLFVNPSQEFVRFIKDTVGINILQFHGQESPEFCISFDTPFIKSVAVSEELDLLEYVDKYSGACGILLDTPTANHGGSGKCFDWGLVSNNLSTPSTPMILAGGLNPGNVDEALRHVNPWAVDVSSGVEGSKKGLKEIRLVKQFVQEVKNADARRVTEL